MPVIISEKYFTVDVVLHKKLGKTKIKISKGKKILYNANADAEVSKWSIKTCVYNTEK